MTISWLLMAAHVPADGQRGGMVRYVVQFARAISTHPEVELHVVADPAAAGFWEPIVGDPQRIHPMRPAPAAAQALLERRGLGSPAFSQPFDVVHGAKHILPRHPRGAGLLTVHDFLPLDRPGDFGRLKRQLLPGPYLDSIRGASALVCVSEATRDRLSCYVPEARPKAHVVPLAGGTLVGVAGEPVAQLADIPFALVVGDDSARKNLHLLVELWPSVTQRHPEAVLVIVGPPSWKDERTRPDPRGVRRLGFLSDAELAWAYRNARVVLCPSVLEGFGLPAREALDLGAQVITSEDPALCEVSGSGAVHVAATDAQRWTAAIAAAFDAPKPPDEASRSVRQWQDVAGETVEVMQRVLHGADDQRR